MRQRVLVILNDPPYGSERSYNGLRLAGWLSRSEEADVRVFLVGDAVGCAAADQCVPEGYYHLDRMIAAVARRGGVIACCGSCLDARGIAEDRLTEGAHRSSVEELGSWTLWADKVVSF